MKRPRKLRDAKRILIVDDHPMMRLGLRQFLLQDSNLEVCAEASSAGEALEEVKRCLPDMVLLDISLEGRSGLDLLKDLRIHHPRIPVLVHSMHDQAIYAERALRAGARGYLMKQETGAKLLHAVRRVLAGEIYLSEKAGGVRSRKSGKQEPQTRVSSLTSREFEVFRLIGAGCVNKEIANLLHISFKTVEAHREHIKRKLGVNSSTSLNLLAVRWQNDKPGR
jgi:DNA-binding NarL/FixJ family response regulator